MIGIDVIDRNYVVVAGACLDRPAHVSPNQWLEFWEARVETLPRNDLAGASCGSCEEVYRDGSGCD